MFDVKDPDLSVRVTRHPNFFEPRDPKPVRISLGCHATLPDGTGLALPVPDITDPQTSLAGALSRFCCRVPEVDYELGLGFAKFVDDFLARFVQAGVEVPDFESWLETTNYPEWRKDELRRANESFESVPLNPEDYECKSFVKDECYPTYKNARAINSRSDRFKAYSGPLFKAVERELFKMPWFIKKVPIPDRPRFIVENICELSRNYSTTDYTVFEASFMTEFMKLCEFKLYSHCLGHESEKLIEAMGGDNICRFKTYTVRVQGKRMSGEMATCLAIPLQTL